ncbi:MAG: hypothetical protein FWD79_07435 [Desulfobulbus sp.]|nr:hypothetical protein [Desulfobulbus sp.]
MDDVLFVPPGTGRWGELFCYAIAEISPFGRNDKRNHDVAREIMVLQGISAVAAEPGGGVGNGTGTGERPLPAPAGDLSHRSNDRSVACSPPKVPLFQYTKQCRNNALWLLAQIDGRAILKACHSEERSAEESPAARKASCAQKDTMNTQ